MAARTLEDIAKKLNISRRTISRVLQNDKNVAEKTRVRILEYLEKEKYFPNIHAASLASKKVNVVGLIFPKDTFIDPDFFALDVLKGVAMAISENKYQLMIFTQDKFDKEQCLKFYKSRLVGGLILVAIASNDITQALEVKKQEVPVTLISSYCDGIDSFGCNNFRGGYIATKYLIDSGRKKIAFIHGHENWFDAKERCKGYKQALSDAGMEVRGEYIEPGYFNYEKGEMAMEKLLALGDPPDAVFAANDRMAIGAYKAIKKVGKKIPEDIAVVGFDNIPLCEHLDPPLTTIEQLMEDIAYESAKVLLNSITSPQQKKKPQIRLLEPKLIVRNST